MQKRILIQNIRLDGGTQSRAKMNNAVVEEYAELMKGEVELPPIQLVQEGETYWLVDGFHRVAAAKKIGDDMIEAMVQDGDFNLAAWLSVAANKAHGLHRTNADKAHAVKLALTRWPGHGSRELAKHIGVSPSTVVKYRNEAEAKVSNLDTSDEKTISDPPMKRKGSDGKMYPAKKADKKEEAEPKRTIFDEAGAEIPEELLPIWKGKFDTKKDIKVLRALKKKYNNIDITQDKYHATFNMQRIIAGLANAINSMSSEMPHAVCLYCGGDGCQACNGRGFLGKLNHDTAPEDMKATMGIK